MQDRKALRVLENLKSLLAGGRVQSLGEEGTQKLSRWSEKEATFACNQADMLNSMPRLRASCRRYWQLDWERQVRHQTGVHSCGASTEMLCGRLSLTSTSVFLRQRAESLVRAE